MAGRSAFRVSGMFICVVLAGCMTAPKSMPAPIPAPMPVAAPPANRPVVAEPSVMPPVAPVTGPAVPEMMAEMVPAPMPVAPPPPPAPVRMPVAIPTEGTALRTRFGAPSFIRREMDSELWRYDSAHCSVFFLFSRAGGDLQLRYTDTLPRGMMGPDPACLDALRQRAEEMAPRAMQAAPVTP